MRGVEVVWGPADAQKILRGVELDLLDELELHYPISAKDLADSVFSGTHWTDRLLEEAVTATTLLLKVQRCRVIVKLKSR